MFRRIMFWGAGALCLISQALGVTVTSPDGGITATVEHSDGKVVFSLKKGSVTIVEPSVLGLVVDGANLGEGISGVSGIAQASEDETYAWHGGKSVATNQCNVMDVVVEGDDVAWSIWVKCFDDGAAYQFVVPGKGTRTVGGDELTRWVIPEGSQIWNYPAYDTASYEAVYTKTPVENLVTSGGGAWLVFPMTVELPQPDLYLAVSESGEFLFPGSIMGSKGNRMLMPRIRETSNGSFSWDGEIRTPWKTFSVGTLNDLVNSDIIPSVAPAPDLSKFKGHTTSWVVPGRCGWTWWSTATPSASAGTPGMDWDRQTNYVDNAAALGFEYYLVDEGWEETAKGWFSYDAKAGKDTPWPRLKQLCDYAATKGVKVMVWRAWQDGAPDNKWPTRVGVETFAQREAFFNNLNAAGAVGAKIDFIHSESKERMQFYHDCIEHAAQKGLMINFHGCNKPRGEARTWPNEISREAIYGLEFEIWKDLPSVWYATIPFTRMLAGHADFTPVTFNPDRTSGTSFSFQLASSIAFTSGSVLCFADDMNLYINSKAYGLLKQLPATWDETIVLPGSEIGELAAMARRKGDEWYVGVINGNATSERSYMLNLSFLGSGTYKFAIYKDDLTEANDLVHMEGTHTASDSVAVEMRAMGGFVMVLTKESLPVNPDFL